MASADNPPQIVVPGYFFYVRPELSFTDVSSSTAIPTTSDGLRYTLLDEETIYGPVLAGVDFVTEWFGGFEVIVDAAGSLACMLHTVHSVNGKSFDHVRTHTIDLDRSTRTFIPMNQYTRVSKVALGPQTIGGTTLNLDENDTREPVDISYILELRLFDNGATTRKAGNLTALRWEGPQTRSYQVNGT